MFENWRKTIKAKTIIYLPWECVKTQDVDRAVDRQENEEGPGEVDVSFPGDRPHRSRNRRFFSRNSVVVFAIGVFRWHVPRRFVQSGRRETRRRRCTFSRQSCCRYYLIDIIFGFGLSRFSSVLSRLLRMRIWIRTTRWWRFFCRCKSRSLDVVFVFLVVVVIAVVGIVGVFVWIRRKNCRKSEHGFSQPLSIVFVSVHLLFDVVWQLDENRTLVGRILTRSSSRGRCSLVFEPLPRAVDSKLFFSRFWWNVVFALSSTTKICQQVLSIQTPNRSWKMNLTLNLMSTLKLLNVLQSKFLFC